MIAHERYWALQRLFRKALVEVNGPFVSSM